MLKSKGIILLMMLVIIVLLAGCGKGSNSGNNNVSSNSNNNTPYTNINGDQLMDKIQKGENFQLIDVREPDEFATGHIKLAVNIPMSQFEQRYSTINKDKDVILICASGARSAAAAAYLTEQGYTKIINVTGGMGNYPGDIVK